MSESPSEHARLNPRCVFKIFRASEWAALDADGTFVGAPIDLEDGYIHLSTADQLEETLAKHFSGVSGLVLAAVALKALPEQAVKWEPSRGGALFPHLYAPLPRSAVAAHTDLPEDEPARTQALKAVLAWG